MTDLTAQERQLIELASRARERAYAPYSKFRVGAAFMDEQGQTFTGCNVENASYGLTVCAERVAIFSAVAQGSHAIRIMAIVTDGDDLGTPCGACRQVMHEFGPDAKIIVANDQNAYVVYHMSELLPHPFTLLDEVKS